ncbi:MAG: formate dehydrogenase accessory protein FdhE [Thermoanaerobaculia bacterium]
MLSLREITRRMVGPAPSGIDPEAYPILRAIWRTYPRAAAGWRAVIPPDQPAPERWAGLRDGIQLLDEDMIRWDADALRQQCRRLFRIFDSPSISRLGAAGSLLPLLHGSDSEPIQWARLFLRGEASERRPELLLGGYIIQPFLYVFARRVSSRLNQEEWNRTRCPVCGGSPYHGYLDPESRRKVLICGTCLCPWTAPRLQCAFCGNSQQDRLFYYYEEQAPRQRIDCCEVCRSALPVTLESESDQPFPLHDHLASLPLQVAVERSSHVDQPS